MAQFEKVGSMARDGVPHFWRVLPRLADVLCMQLNDAPKSGKIMPKPGEPLSMSRRGAAPLAESRAPLTYTRTHHLRPVARLANDVAFRRVPC